MLKHYIDLVDNIDIQLDHISSLVDINGVSLIDNIVFTQLDAHDAIKVHSLLGKNGRIADIVSNLEIKLSYLEKAEIEDLDSAVMNLFDLIIRDINYIAIRIDEINELLCKYEGDEQIDHLVSALTLLRNMCLKFK